MKVPDARTLLRRIRSLPAAAPLLARLNDEPGVYLVGGAVRDLLRGGTPGDLDLVVEGDASALAERLGGRRRVHDRFGTSTVQLDGHSYDIARARRETYIRPGALPRVAPASLEEDLLRRDFTVNAMAVALTGEGAGGLRAAPHALEDLKRERLRILHDGSFLDDPTRLLRFVRYTARLGFAPEGHTRALVRAAVDEHALRTVSGSRIGAELRQLAREPDPVAALKALHEYRLDREIDPRFGLTDSGPARSALATAPPDLRRDRLVLAAASRGIGAAQLRALLDRLAFEAADRDAIVEVATRAQALSRDLAAAETPSQVAAAADAASPEAVALAGALGAREQACEWLERLRHVRLEIDGGDLVEAGVAQGPAIGAGLKAALAAKLDGRARTRAQELAEAMRGATANG